MNGGGLILSWSVIIKSVLVKHCQHGRYDFDYSVPVWSAGLFDDFVPLDKTIGKAHLRTGKTQMKTPIPILALLLFTNIAMGQMPCTNDCGGGSTNEPIIIQPIPLGALQLRIRPNDYGLSNTAPNHLYQIEASTNLLDWSLLQSGFTNVGGEKSFAWTNRFIAEFFRAQDVSTNWFYRTVLSVSQTVGNCIGSSLGYANYYDLLIDDRTAVHWLAAGPDTRIEYAGFYGDIGCATNVLYLTNPPSPEYYIRVHWKTNLPNTNILHGVPTQGFLP